MLLDIYQGVNQDIKESWYKHHFKKVYVALKSEREVYTLDQFRYMVGNDYY